ncbi:hypothetical protein FG446_003736 [Yersinia enterocolitica]|nr:hypothetical protein [Yersinia enterocolitica]
MNYKNAAIAITKTNGVIYQQGDKIVGFTLRRSPVYDEFYKYCESTNQLLRSTTTYNTFVESVKPTFKELRELTKNDEFIPSHTQLPIGETFEITYTFYNEEYSIYYFLQDPDDIFISIKSHNSKCTVVADTMFGFECSGCEPNTRPEFTEEWIFQQSLIHDVDYRELERLLLIGDKLDHNSKAWIY